MENYRAIPHNSKCRPPAEQPAQKKVWDADEDEYEFVPFNQPKQEESESLKAAKQQVQQNQQSANEALDLDEEEIDTRVHKSIKH